MWTAFYLLNMFKKELSIAVNPFDSALCQVLIQGAAEQIKRFGGVNTRPVVGVGWCTWSPSALSMTPFQ
jgi:hypothetical protein